MSDRPPETAGVIAPPPVIFAGAVGVGLALQKARPLPVLPVGVRKPLGVGMAATAIALGGSAVAALKGAGTNVNPYQPTSAIVAGGPYRFSRNPIYLGMAMLGAGIGLLANAGWVLALLPAAVAVIEKGVIEREEAYLHRSFPVAYQAYKERVRRWL